VQQSDGTRTTDTVDLTKRHERLLGRTALVSVLTLVSRLLGFVREILSAALFGDKSAIFDAFITAWRVPNLFRRFLGEGALSTSFQTALTKVDGDVGLEGGRRLFHATFWLLSWILLALTGISILVVAFLPDRMPITDWLWLGADPAPVRELIMRVMPFVLLACISALIGGALQVRGHFAAPAWAPATLNIVWIGALLAIAGHFGWRGDEGAEFERHMQMTRWLAWGVLSAGLVQIAVQLPALARFGFLERPVTSPPPSARPDSVRAWDVLRRSAPLALGAAVYQINVMMDGLMAEGLLPDGGPTLHYYANRVQQFPMALIAIAATSAVFPALQAHGHRGDLGALKRLHDKTHRAILYVALPASVGLFALSTAVISACFEHGAFGAEGVTRAAAALRCLALAIIPAGATGLVARTYYSLDDFKTPVRVSITMLVANVVLNLVCIRTFGMDVDGLALATALTSWGGLLLMLPGLTTKLALPRREAGFFKPFPAMIVAAVLMGWVASLVQANLVGSSGRFVALTAAIVTGLIVYQSLSTALRVPEATEVWARLRRKSRPH